MLDKEEILQVQKNKTLQRNYKILMKNQLMQSAVQTHKKMNFA